MKHYDFPQWKQTRAYVFIEILPKVQEIFRDSFYNEKISISLSLVSGDDLSVFVAEHDTDGTIANSEVYAFYSSRNITETKDLYNKLVAHVASLL